MLKETYRGKELKYCNCAECNQVLLGRSFLSWYRGLSAKSRDQLRPITAGHINNRPYCDVCLQTAELVGHLGIKEEIGPSQQNASRHLEGA